MLLVLVAIANIIFALACGCVSGGIVAGLSPGFRDAVTHAEVQEGLREAVRDAASEAGDMTRPVARALADAMSDPRVLVPAHTAADGHPAMGAVRTGTLVAAVSQAVLLIASILLLSRKNAGRMLSMMALAAFIIGSVWGAFQSSGPITSYGETALEHVAEVESYQALSDAEKRELDEALALTFKYAHAPVVVMASVANIWPVISLLILLMSRSIQEACAPRALPS